MQCDHFLSVNQYDQIDGVSSGIVHFHLNVTHHTLGPIVTLDIASQVSHSNKVGPKSVTNQHLHVTYYFLNYFNNSLGSTLKLYIKRLIAPLGFTSKQNLNFER